LKNSNEEYFEETTIKLMLRIEENDIQTEKMSQKLTEFTSSGTYPNLNDAVIKFASKY
jgi:hypothetical protein